MARVAFVERTSLFQPGCQDCGWVSTAEALQLAAALPDRLFLGHRLFDFGWQPSL